MDSTTCQDVKYGGDGDPTKLIVSDEPLQGDSAERSKQMNDAIEQDLDNENWKTGQTDVALQICDDSIASTGEWDEATCKANATAYAKNPDVMGVIGTYNSGCAALEIPILNTAGGPGEGVPMVSPGNTYVCLTEPSPTVCKPDEPDKYYPNGAHNYIRVIPNDAFQGAGIAQFVQEQQVKKPYILYAADDPTSTGQADNFEGAAKSLGMQVAGKTTWDPEAASYTDVMNKVKKSGADAVLLAGLIDQNGDQVIKDKVAVLGPNEGDQAAAQLFAMDGFAQQSTIDQAGDASAGMFVSVPGRSPSALTGEGKAFVDQLKSKVGSDDIELFAPYAGEAAQTLLAAAAPSPEHKDIINAFFGGLEIDKGITGVFTITETGDPSVGPISVTVARDTFEPAKVIEPPANLVDAARGE